MFERFRQTFYFSPKIPAKKNILSENKFVVLQSVNALYVRVETFAKQSIPNKSFSHKYLAYIYS